MKDVQPPENNDMQDLARTIRAKIAKAESDLKAMKNALAIIERSAGSTLRFANAKSPSDAIRMLVEKDGPQTDEQAINALLEGGIASRYTYPRREIVKAIGEALKPKGGLVRLADGRLDVKKR